VAEMHGNPLVLVAPDSLGVGTAMRDAVGHDIGELAAVRLLVAPGDSAHGSVTRSGHDPGITARAATS